MNREQGKREMILGLAWGGAMVVLALVMVLLRKMGSVDADTVTRVVIGSNGLMVAWYGNRLPKNFVASAQAREAQRVAAWSQVLSGIVWVALWAFAPISVAVAGGIAAIVTGFVVTIGYCLSLGRKAKGSA